KAIDLSALISFTIIQSRDLLGHSRTPYGTVSEYRGSPVPKFKSVADCVRQGDGRYNADRSLYLVVRGGSALWEKQFRTGGKLKTKCYGSAVGAAPVSL